jgi:hypothetical protein
MAWAWDSRVKISVEPSTMYRYDSPVHLEPRTFRLRPRLTNTQRLNAVEIQIAPTPTGSAECLDQEGNLALNAGLMRSPLVDENSLEDPWLLPPSRRAPEKPIPGPLPATVRIVRSNLLFVDKAGLPDAMLNRLTRLAAFQNPEFYKAQAMRLRLCCCWLAAGATWFCGSISFFI